MEKFKIIGGTHLRGKVTVSGSKNAVLPIIAATIIHPAVYKLSNVPEIDDVKIMLKIMRKMGAEIKKVRKNVFEINTKKISSYEPDYKLVRNIRASVLFIGPLLARFGKVKIAQPGGCFIGSRPLTTHFTAFEKLGVSIEEEGGYYILSAKRMKTNKKVVLGEISVTATENILMAASKINFTKIRLAASEPHVEDLCNFLIKIGVTIEGINTHNLKVYGNRNFKSYIEHRIIPDQIEAGTLAIAAAVSRGNVEINDFISDHNDILLNKFEEIGINFEARDKKLFIKPSTVLKAVNIRTDIYPGFPTDLQAPMVVLLTQAEGTSEINETMFESRFGYMQELKKMGADVVISGVHHALVTGSVPLYGTKISSFDLRAGATLIIASLIAEGESEIDNIYLIDRGYENIEKKLNSLGAKIERVIH